MTARAMPTAIEIRGALDTLERARVATDALRVGDVVIVPMFSDAITIAGYRDATVKEIGAGSNDQLRTITTSAGTFQCADAYRHYRASTPVKRAKSTPATLPEIMPTPSHVESYAVWQAFRAGTWNPYGDRPSSCVAHLPRASAKRRPGDKLRRANPDLCAWLTDAFYSGNIHSWSIDETGSAWLVRRGEGSDWETFTTDELRDQAAGPLRPALESVAA